MSNKRNLNLYIEFLKNKSIESDVYFSRINDTMEENLYSSVDRLYYGVTIGGYSQESTVTNKELLSTNPIQLVDLGDGIGRYKTRVKLFSNAFGSATTSPTDHLQNLDFSRSEAEFQAIISNYPMAYTENKLQIPVFGSHVLVEEFENTYYIRRIISTSPEMYRFVTTGGGLGSRDSHDGGIPETNVIVSNTESTDIKEFIKKLKNSGYFNDWSKESLAGLVSNAGSETAWSFRGTIGGDPPSYWQKKLKTLTPGTPEYLKAETKYQKVAVNAVKGYGLAKGVRLYCSWGYWQLQVCSSGAGSKLAKERGIDISTEAGKQAWAALIQDDDVQFEFVSRILKEKGFHNYTDAAKAGTKICTDFERPAGSGASFTAVYTTGDKKGEKKNPCPGRGAKAAKILKEYASHF